MKGGDKVVPLVGSGSASRPLLGQPNYCPLLQRTATEGNLRRGLKNSSLLGDFIVGTNML